MGSVYMTSATPTSGYLGRCLPCSRPVRDTAIGGGDHRVISCPDCRGTLTAERVYGTTNAMQCDPRCEGAYGPICVCGCGGVNHGGSWSKAGTMLADELAAYRAAQAAVEVKREAKATAKRAAAKSAFAAWRDQHAALAKVLSDQSFGGSFMADMSWQVLRGEPLTERQTEVAERIMREDAEHEATKAAEALAAKPVPAGKAIQVTGEIVSVRVEPSPFGPGDVSKMLVKGDGWKVWVSVPKAIADVNATSPGNHYGLMNKRVTLTADIERSRDDESFGYGKRPRGAEVTTAEIPDAVHHGDVSSRIEASSQREAEC